MYTIFVINNTMAAFLLQHRAAFLSCAVGTIDVGLEAWDTGLFDAIDKANRVRPGDFLSRLSRAGVDVHPAFELDNAPAEALCYISIKGHPTPEVAVTRALVEMSRFVYAEPKHQVDIIDGAESLRTILEKRVFIGGDLRRFVVQVNDCMATPMTEDPSWQFSANGEVFLVNEPLRLVRVVGSTSSAVDMGMLYNFALAIRRSDNTKHLCLARPGENPCYISSRVVRIVTDPNREEISIYHTNNSAIGLLPIVE